MSPITFTQQRVITQCEIHIRGFGLKMSIYLVFVGPSAPAATSS